MDLHDALLGHLEQNAQHDFGPQHHRQMGHEHVGGQRNQRRAQDDNLQLGGLAATRQVGRQRFLVDADVQKAIYIYICKTFC